MDITTNFTLEEFEASDMADQYGLNNSMPARYFYNLSRLCCLVLQPLRSHLSCPIKISSGYRCPQLNEFVNGSRTSQHMTAQAADIQCCKMNELIDVLKRGLVQFDQCIVYETFVHISYVNMNANRKQFIDKRA